MNPTEEYKSRLQARRERVRHLLRMDRRVAAWRLVAAVAFIVVAWLAWRRAFSGWWTLLPLGTFVTLVGYHAHLYRLGRRAHRAVLFYERGLARIEDRWHRTGDIRTVILDDAHPYSVDLDIFGIGSLFELLSNARTRSGEQTLGQWLCAPASRPEILKRQEAVEELRNNLDLREDLAVLGEDVKDSIHPDLMKRWGLAPAILESRNARIIAPILAVLGVFGLIWYGVFDGSGWILLAGLGAEAAFGLYYRDRVRAVIASLDQPVKDLEVLSLVLERLEREKFKSEKLYNLRAALDAESKPPSRHIAWLTFRMQLFDSRLNPFHATISALLLLTTQLAFSVEAWRSRHGALIGPWLDAVGEMEALCSLAGYAYEHPADPFPEIAESGACFEGAELRHPLLPGDRAVANSVHLNGNLQLLVVSGSNMSGKSTLLRTVGVNAVLAFAGGPVRARHLRLSVLRIGATLRVVDSLQTGTSRFYAEIQRIRDIMEMTNGPEPVLFLLDEILHGTNSHDRAVGAEAVVKGLIQRGAIGLVTTHDLALAQVAKALGTKAANIHFEDQLVDGRMVFDYRVRPGVVEHSNALALMRAVGLDV